MTTAPETLTGSSVLDWSVLELDGVTDRIKMAATRVAQSCAGQVHHDREDLAQEGRIIAATNPGAVRGFTERGELNHLYVWMRSKLLDKAKVEVARAGKTYSRDRLLETVEDGTW